MHKRKEVYCTCIHTHRYKYRTSALEVDKKHGQQLLGSEGFELAFAAILHAQSEYFW